MKPVGGRGRVGGRGGFAAAVVLALAVLMAVFVISMQRMLFRVKSEVLRIEERHEARQLPAAGGAAEDPAKPEGGAQ
jgi:hypothetical protein